LSRRALFVCKDVSKEQSSGFSPVSETRRTQSDRVAMRGSRRALLALALVALLALGAPGVARADEEDDSR
jgi:hypothetical protein